MDRVRVGDLMLADRVTERTSLLPEAEALEPTCVLPSGGGRRPEGDLPSSPSWIVRREVRVGDV
jgi:hypothetical protein